MLQITNQATLKKNKNISLLAQAALSLGAILIFNSCKPELKSQSKYLENRTVIFESEGYKLDPGILFTTDFTIPTSNHPMKRSLRVTGSTILPEKFGKRSENVFREHCYHIDDYLVSDDTYGKDDFALVYVGENENYEKNAFYRISHEQLKSFNGDKVQVNLPLKRDINGFEKEGFFKLKLHLFEKKQGRALDDIFDDADQIWEMEVPAGTSDWEVITKDLIIPGDIACILVQISSKNMQGNCKVGTPWFTSPHAKLPFYPFQPFIKNHQNWIGENLSSKEWPEFEFSIDGNPFFTGKIFDRASEIGEFDLNLPDLESGQHKLSMKLLDRFPAKYPFLLKAIEFHENSSRDFEIVYVPEFVNKDNKFGILLEINKPGIKLKVSGDEEIEPLTTEKHFEEMGLHTITFAAKNPSIKQKIAISDGSNVVFETVGQIINKEPDSIYISTGDDIYITRTKEQWSKYLKWHMREGIGNMYCWRPSHQWSGAIGWDPEFYNWAVNILQDLQMPYALMTEGRTLPGRDINPSTEVMDSPFFLGRQSHEDDGSFYYWDQFVWEGLYSDLAAKFRPYGGIFAKTRPIKNDNGIFIFYDPYGADNMAKGAQQFVNNLSKSRGESTRHTGPSTMFRYFFQAGYEWVGAEQMYGPEELIMSSMRGASKAYGKNSFGTHLATQWGTQPFNDTDHATRFFLSLAISYIHGATNINTEEGVWNMEEGIDRFTKAGRAHIKRQRDLLHFIETHERRGKPVAPVGIIQGRNDGWKSFDFRVKSNTWGQRGEQWKYGAPEESFELIKTFYPENELGEITLRAHEPRLPKGFYTSTPYGLVDLFPIEAPQNVIDDYQFIAFLGWNTYQQDDFEKLLSFVVDGGTLLMSAVHANTELRRNQSVTYPAKDDVLKALLGEDYKDRNEKYERKVGKGKVIFYPQKLYPSEPLIKEEYQADLKKLLDDSILDQIENGWIEGADNIEFAAWDWDDNKTRTIYLLNIDWWSIDTSHAARLRIGDSSFDIEVRRDVLEAITVSGDVAVKPSTMTTDVLDISKNNSGYQITVQTASMDTLDIYHINKGVETHKIMGPGIHTITINDM